MSYRLLLFLLVWTIVSCKSKEKVANTDTTQPSKVEVKADAKNQNTVQTNSAPVDMGNSESPKSEEMAFPGAEKLSGTWELSAFRSTVIVDQRTMMRQLHWQQDLKRTPHNRKIGHQKVQLS